MDREVIINPGAFSEVPEALLRAAGLRVLWHEGAVSAEISVTLLDDVAIRSMNRDYLDRDRPTDVIAFSLGDEGRTIGDVYVGYEQAARQAHELGIELREELVRLTIHGTLHVLGHDHPEGDERFDSPMYRLQERLLHEVLAARGSR